MIEALVAILKALSHAAALSGAGLVLIQQTLAVPQALAAKALLRTAGAVLALGACFSTVLTLYRLGGFSDPSIMGAVFLSSMGAGLALQVAGGMLLVATGRRSAVIAGALMILLSFGVVGHSAARGLLSSATVVTHVTTAAWWLGGLWTLHLGSRRLPPVEFSQLVKGFSRQAIWIVTILVAAALATAALLLEFRVDTDRVYVRGLLAKASLTAALLALACVNRLVLSTRLADSPRDRVWLKRSVAAELCLFACIITVTAWLTTTQSPT